MNVYILVISLGMVRLLNIIDFIAMFLSIPLYSDALLNKPCKLKILSNSGMVLKQPLIATPLLGMLKFYCKKCK